MSDHGCSYKNGLQDLDLNISLHSHMRSITSEQLRRKYGVTVDHIRYVVVDADGAQSVIVILIVAWPSALSRM